MMTADPARQTAISSFQGSPDKDSDATTGVIWVSDEVVAHMLLCSFVQQPAHFGGGGLFRQDTQFTPD